MLAALPAEAQESLGRAGALPAAPRPTRRSTRALVRHIVREPHAQRRDDPARRRDPDGTALSAADRPSGATIADRARRRSAASSKHALRGTPWLIEHSKESNATSWSTTSWSSARGPAGLACAIRLKQLKPELNVCVLEKARERGLTCCRARDRARARSMSCCRGWRDEPPGICVPATRDEFSLLTKTGATACRRRRR